MPTVLISGAGIAGPALAWWLHAAGITPTLIEAAPAPRTGGYVIDFWGLGYAVAARMGLTAALERSAYHVRELRIVDDGGHRISGFGTQVFDSLTGGRFVTLQRSALSAELLRAISGLVEVNFGDEIVSRSDYSSGLRPWRCCSAIRSATTANSFTIVFRARGGSSMATSTLVFR